MNFISALQELDKLYEAEEHKVVRNSRKLKESTVKNNKLCTKGDCLKEADEEIVIDGEPIVDDEIVVDEPVEADDKETVDVEDYVLECSKCGALVIKAIKEVTEDEESGLANVGEECAYCESSDGFKILGTFAPYEDEAPEEAVEAEVIEDTEDDEVIEEGIFDNFKKNKDNKEPGTIRGYKRNDVSFSKQVAKELKAKFGGEVKSVKLSRGEDADIWVDTNNKAKAAEKYISKQYPDEAFSFDEYYLVKDLEEGIFDRKKKSTKKAAGSVNNDDVKREVNFKVYDQNGTLKFNRDFTELPGKMNADGQFKHAFKDTGVYNEYRNSDGKRDWSFERVSNPPSPAFDTKKGRTKFLSMDLHLEDLDQQDGELEELFDANLSVDAQNFAGSDNKVSVLGLGESVEDEELEEVFDANISLDAGGFGGNGNNVSVLSGGLGEEFEQEDDEELEELFDANVSLDARGFGGSGNTVGIL